MARLQLLLCFTILFASVTLLDVVSAHLKTNPSLPEIEDPKTVKDVEPYTVNVVMVFVSNLEKECPKTNKFSAFFEKLKGFAKYVCPINGDERDIKAKAGSLFQTIASFAVGKIKEEIQEEKSEVMNNLKFMKSVVSKILGGRKKDESEESMKLTTEQVKEIKEGILSWQIVIAKITNTMLVSTTTTTTSSSSEDSTKTKESSSSGSEKTFKDTTGPNSDLGSPSGSPSISPSGSSSLVAGESEASLTGTTDTESPASSPSSSSSSSSSDTKTTGSSQKGVVTLTEVEADTSKEVMTFLMNLEKKCPPKEEFKSFFEQLKVTMTTASSEVSKTKKSFLAHIKSAAGKLYETMALMRSRIGSKSAEVKESLETYQGEVMKAVQELEAIHSQIVSQNKGKKDGSLTCTPAQQKEIQVTITKWEQVTTKFVETAIQSETKSSSSTTSSVTKEEA